MRCVMWLGGEAPSYRYVCCRCLFAVTSFFVVLLLCGKSGKLHGVPATNG